LAFGHAPGSETFETILNEFGAVQADPVTFSPLC
jgi:hypothetical protein